MKTSTLCFAAALLWSLTAVARPEALPEGSQGQVTLDWQKFNDLWTNLKSLEKRIETLQNPELAPPVPFTITRAAYKGMVGKEKVILHALYEIDVFEPKKWVKIPFLPASTALQSAALDGATVGVVQQDGFHCLVLKSPGRHILAATFVVKAPREEEEPHLHFDIPETPITLLSLELPRPHLQATIEPSQGVESVSTDRGQHTLITAAIPTSAQLDIRWQKAPPEELAGPAKLYLETQTLLTLSEGTVHALATLNYNILHKGVRDLRVGVPEGWNVLSVTGEGLQEWKPQGSELAIQFAYAKKGTVQVVITAEKSIGEKESVLDIAALKPLNVEREEGTIGIESKGSIELQVQKAGDLNPIDPQELPGSLWQSATQPILYAFRYSKPHQLALAVRRHPEVAVLTTTVDNANAVTLVTARGQMITRMRYDVRNHLKQYLAIRLPAHAQLWSAFVGGLPVKPMQTAEGSYRIPLAKSQIDSGGQAGFPVEIVYYMAAPRFQAFGSRTVVFPVPDAPVSRAMCSLYLPERYRFLHFGGDMEKGMLASPWNALAGEAFVQSKSLASRKSIEAASPMLLSRARDSHGRELDMLAQNMGVMGGGAGQNELAKKQAVLEGDVLGTHNEPLAQGVFPVAFQVPAAGQLFHFGQVMIVDESPRVSMFFVHVWIVRLVTLLLLAWVGMVLYRHRLKLLKALGYTRRRFADLERVWRSAGRNA